MSTKTDCVAILANRPEDANYLSPLVPLIGFKKVEYLYRAMLFDTIAAALDTGTVSVAIFYRPAKAEPEFKRLLELFVNEEADNGSKVKLSRIILKPVAGKDFSQRAADIFNYGFKSGFKKVALITNCNPTISPEIIGASLALLKYNQAVIGPSFDGDCYLMGLAVNRPEIFEKVPDTKHNRYFALKENVKRAGLTLQELEISYMVSCAEELNQLIDDIECWRRIGDLRTAGHTERFLRTLA
ncbi:MAG: DUF2064 domain-containing protein [candidate division Zixibacteria bacterium]|nr:DUF2064 domain-containing protein [candidate division Zixibacteria bacterium]